MSFDIVTLRGFVEKIIDGQLAKENIAKMHAAFETLRPVVKNREDAIFGYIIGWTSAYMIQTITAVLERNPTQEEHKEIAKALYARASEDCSKHSTRTPVEYC